MHDNNDDDGDTYLNVTVFRGRGRMDLVMRLHYS